MTPLHARKQFLETTRGRIVNVLRRTPATVDEIAHALGVTENAVRAQLTAMERDGLVQRASQRRGVTRPSTEYTLTPEIEHIMSGAYVPLLRELLRLLAARMSPKQLDDMLRQVGRDLAAGLPGAAPTVPLVDRVKVASALLDEEFGAVTHVERTNGHFTIRGQACPLSAITDKHPAACSAIESFLAEMLRTRVRECCDRSARPRCCFEVFARSR